MNSLRRRLLLILIGAMSVVMALGALGTYQAAQEEANAIFDYHLEQIAFALRNQTFQGPAEAIAGDQNFDFVIRVWDQDGLSVFFSRPHQDLPNIVHLGYSTENTSEGPWRVYALQFQGQTIAVAQPLRVRNNIAANAALRTLLPFIILLPLVALIIWLVVSRELRPLTALAQSVSTRSATALEPFAENGIPEEARPLVRSLNDLLARLQASMQSQRNFIADAAHELRTPLTALQLQTQLLERAGNDERSAALANLKNGLERTIHTVQQLLTLARQEPGATQHALVGVALDEIARQVVADHATLAAARDIDLGIAATTPDAKVEGDPEALRTLLANLVGNAVRYTPAGGRVDVSCGIDEGKPFLEVADTGPGIPPEEREHVFDRFYRRANDDAPGSGLGLAIVRTIAQRHGARVALSDAEGGGLLVRVAFPSPATPVSS
ncbi:MAG: ATP-binding protein [Betaproteobacteria bacterium]